MFEMLFRKKVKYFLCFLCVLCDRVCIVGFLYVFNFCFGCFFVDWLKESKRQPAVPFEQLAAEDLAPLFKDFYYCARSKKNKMYSISGLKGLRAGLQRHLEGKPFFRKFCIARDATFSEANQVFTGYISKLRKDGLDTTEHKRPILPGDIARLYENVFDDTPQGLLF